MPSHGSSTNSNTDRQEHSSYHRREVDVPEEKSPPSKKNHITERFLFNTDFMKPEILEEEMRWKRHRFYDFSTD